MHMFQVYSLITASCQRVFSIYCDASGPHRSRAPGLRERVFDEAVLKIFCGGAYPAATGERKHHINGV